MRLWKGQSGRPEVNAGGIDILALRLCGPLNSRILSLPMVPVELSIRKFCKNSKTWVASIRKKGCVAIDDGVRLS